MPSTGSAWSSSVFVHFIERNAILVLNTTSGNMTAATDYFAARLENNTVLWPVTTIRALRCWNIVPTSLSRDLEIYGGQTMLLEYASCTVFSMQEV